MMLKAMMDKTAGTLAVIKAIAPNCTSNHYVLTITSLGELYIRISFTK
jgi:hypothetical protein